MHFEQHGFTYDFSTPDADTGLYFHGGKTDDKVFKNRIRRLYEGPDKIAYDFFTTIGCRTTHTLIPEDGLFDHMALTTTYFYPRTVKNRKVYEIPHIQFLTEPQIDAVLNSLGSIIKTKSRFLSVLRYNQPLPITSITQEDVDKTYIDAFDFIEYKQNKWQFINTEGITFSALSSVSPNGTAQRSMRDLINRIKKQNGQIPKMSASHWEIIHAGAKMVEEGHFQECIRDGITQIIATFLAWIDMLNDKSDRINFSRYIYTSGKREDMLILRDSNFPIRLSMVAQAIYVLASVDGYLHVERCVNVMLMLLIWQCFRRILTVSPKDIINTFSLYNGIKGKEESNREAGTPHTYRTKHSHPMYTVDVDAMFKGPPEWIAPLECTGCELGNYQATLNFRKEMYLSVAEKYKKSCEDLFEIFPNFEREFLRLLILRANYNLIRTSRCIVMCLVVPFISGPSAITARNEVKSIEEHKVKSDMYRAKNPDEYKLFEQLVDEAYEKFIKNSAQVANITPLEVAGNLDAYISNNSASMGSLTVYAELMAERGMKAEVFPIRTTSKRMIVAFARDRHNLLSYYMLTESLQNYRLRVKQQKDEYKQNKNKKINHIKWRRKTVGVREDPGREPRQMYQQDLYTIMAENIVARHILDGSTGGPVHGYNVDWFGPERPSEIMTNSMVNQISMICKICMGDNRSNYFSFSTDASSFDKSSRSTEYFDRFFKILNDYQLTYHPRAQYHIDAGVTVDGKKVTYSQLVALLRDVYRAPTFEIPGAWSSLALTAAYTNSGSTITFMQNSMTNIANQRYMIGLLQGISSGCSSGGTIQEVDVVVAGDDAVSTVRMESGIFTQEFFGKLAGAFDKLSLISGYSLNAAKGAVWGTEVAKLYTACGMVMNHKATTLNREKRSTAQTTVENMASMGTLKFLTMERSMASDDTARFLNALSGMRILENNEDGLYITLTSGFVSTLPSRNGGAGLPLFIDMNEPIITIMLTHGYYQDLCLLFGLADVLQEKAGKRIRERLKRTFEKALHTGKGIRFKSSIDGVDFDAGNLKNFFPVDRSHIKTSQDSASQLVKRTGGRLKLEDNAIKNIMYANSQTRAIEMLVNGIPLPIYEEEDIRYGIMLATQNELTRKGKTLVNRMRDDDPLYGHIIISKLELCNWESNHMTPFPCSHEMIHKMTAHYGMKAGRVVSFDYLAFIDTILGKYGAKAKVPAVASINFLTTVLNQKFTMDTENLRLLFSAMYGLSPETMEEADMIQLSLYLQSEQTFLHMSEPSTSMVYINDSILETITLHSTKISRNRRRLITSLKHVLITICRLYDKAIKSIEFVIPDQYVDVMRYYSDRLDATYALAKDVDSRS